MFCLTVRQPWASAIFEENKIIENRTWNTSYRGIIAIHSSARQDTFFTESTEFTECKIRKSFIQRVHNKELPLGMILGVVELYDVVANSSNSWARTNCFHFKLRNPRLLPKPIKARGQLRLWQPSLSLERAIRRQLK